MALNPCNLRLAFLALPLALIAGCGPETPQTIPVTGRITYGGGAWPQPGRLTFPCKEPAAGFPRRPGHAEFGASGDFTATSYTPGDGLHPGKYVLQVECWEVRPTMEDPESGKSYAPADFHYEFEVLPDDDEVELVIDVPKTAAASTQ